ncbi:MAG: NAD(P)H-hydrate dehydratase [Rubrivivax sp.]|nr:NAD(P)H-hydrate dehydratase [Rubrivivax sp.]
MSETATLQRIAPERGPWPLHDAATSRAAERQAQSQAAPFSLMARAGLAVARLALARWPHARSVQVWAGPGNNGGDGLVAARHLQAAGIETRVVLLGEPDRLPADAHRACAEALQTGARVQVGLPAAAWTADLVIDALLGIGVSRAPEGRLAEAIACIHAQAAPVLAVDLPSGLHPDTGRSLGAACIHATATLSLLTLKPGLFTASGRDAAGEAWFDGLGIHAGPPSAWLAGPMALAACAHASHKGSRGDVAVVGGAAGMAGAAWLAARAALAAGAGRVYCSPLDPAPLTLDWNQPELMVRPGWWMGPPESLAASTVVAGCGGGHEVAGALPVLLSRAGRLVVDADGLNALAADASLREALRRRGHAGRPTLLTPHPLEAARLLGRHTADVQADRLATARELAESLGTTVLLKGSGSIVASPGELPLVIPTGNAALATAGTGDVLAGWLAGLWAQTPQAPPHRIAGAGAWSHGRAADLWRAAALGAPLRASDLVNRLARRSF